MGKCHNERSIHTRKRLDAHSSTTACKLKVMFLSYNNPRWQGNIKHLCVQNALESHSKIGVRLPTNSSPRPPKSGSLCIGYAQNTHTSVEMLKTLKKTHSVLSATSYNVLDIKPVFLTSRPKEIKVTLSKLHVTGYLKIRVQFARSP